MDSTNKKQDFSELAELAAKVKGTTNVPTEEKTVEVNNQVPNQRKPEKVFNETTVGHEKYEVREDDLYLELELSEEEYEKLKCRAKRYGISVENYIHCKTSCPFNHFK